MINIFNKIFIDRQLSFFKIVLFSFIINSLLITFLYYLNDGKSLIFSIIPSSVGDWKSFWESVLLAECKLYAGCLLDAPFPFGYFIKYLSLNTNYVLIFTAVVYSISFALVIYFLQEIFVSINKKFSFIALLSFFLSPMTYVYFFTYYKESFFCLSIISLLYSYALILNKDKSINFRIVIYVLILLFSIFCMLSSRRSGITILFTISSIGFIFVLFNALIINKDIWKIIFFKFISLIFLFILTVNIYANGIGIMRHGELILFDVDLSIPFFSDSILIESKNIKDKTSNDTSENYEIKDFAESYLNPKNYSKFIVKNQLNRDDITSYFRFQDINILNKLNLMFIQPSPKFIITKLQTGNINKTILLIEIIFFYICLVFLVKGIIFNTNYLSIIILTISAIIIYVLIDFESYLGTYVRHRFIFWKLINSIGSIYLFQFIYNIFENAKKKT